MFLVNNDMAQQYDIAVSMTFVTVFQLQRFGTIVYYFDYKPQRSFLILGQVFVEIFLPSIEYRLIG